MSPPRKKLRQSTLLDTFLSTSTSTDDSQEEDSLVEEKQEVLEDSSDMDKRMREKLAVAAEKRAGKSAPVTVELKSPEQNEDPTHGATSESQVSQCSTTQSVGDGSAILFSDNEDENSNSSDDTPSLTKTQPQFKGCTKDELLTTPGCAASLPRLECTSDHTVLVNFCLRTEATVPMSPNPSTYCDHWDTEHVRMPCSRENLYPVESPGGKKELQNRWTLIKSALQVPLTSSYDIEEAILIYNSRYANKWEFSGLHSFLNEVLTQAENRQFFSAILPKMVKLTLDLPEICTQALPLLKRGNGHSLTISQYQAASLLANAFFCTYPRRNTRQKSSEYSTFPDINFNDLFNGRNRADSRKKEKLRCLLEYFRRVSESMPTGNLTFRRKCLPESEYPDWARSGRPLPRLTVQSSGTIEDDGYGMLQVDFANKFLGGGVLNSGLVQEEIRFMICPEMILSRLVTEVLQPNESLLMIGCERFSNYTGYGDTFVWDGPHYDSTPRDDWERRHCEVVAIDAVRFSIGDRQYSEAMVKREVLKAYCGFYDKHLPPEKLPAVATGNWGCGAFRGDPRLKFLIQMMAVAECRRDICYFTFGDPDLCTDLYDMYVLLADRDVTVGDLFALIHQYGRFVETRRNQTGHRSIFRYIMDSLLDRNTETDSEVTNDSSPDWGAKIP